MSRRSLFDPPGDPVLAGLASWSESLVFGQLAIPLSVIAVAFLGFWMLSGRLRLNRGIRTLLGVFVLLGAPAIAASFVASSERPQVASLHEPPVERAAERDLPPADYDPYAGASLRRD